MPDFVRCHSCDRSVPEDEAFATEGKTLCEDCYIDLSSRIRACDPWGRGRRRSTGRATAWRGLMD